MNKKLVLLGAGLLMAVTASAQKHVTGRVTDAHGEPVMGAQVRVPGTKIVTTTDAQGRFRLNNVPSSAQKLQVSYIGMQTSTVSVAGNVQVVLKDNELSEAVVVGYGTARKVGTVVGSISTVGAQKIENKPTPNVLDALQGQVAGLSIMSSSGDVGTAITNGYSATIRGAGSLNASSTPLFVVDGVPTSSSVLGMMSSNDIASVTVLKGASATSIYGSRAANGVIYITTKKGRNNESAQITISQSMGWQQLARPLGDRLTADELLDLRLQTGLISGDEYEAAKQAGVNTDWQKYNFDNAAPMYETNFSIRGGSEKTTYYSSASYFKQNGIRPGSQFKRITFRTNLDSKPKDWLSYGVNIAFNYDRRRSDSSTSNGDAYVNGGNLGTILTDPTVNPYDEDGNRLKTWYNPLIGDNQYDPYYQAKKSMVNYNDLRSVSSAYINLNPVKGLNLRSQLSLDAVESRGSGKGLPSYEEYGGYGSASESFSRNVSWTITNTAEYKFKVADAHDVTVLLGQEGIRGTSDGFSASTRGQSNDKITTLGNGLEISSLPSSSSSEYQYLSFFGRLDYSYLDKYFLNFTVRNDQCSRFGRNHKGATFYSGGVMWDVMTEEFAQNLRGWLNSLQVRADVGSTGNSSIGDYAHLSLLGNGQYGTNYAYALSQLGTENLTWEKQIQTTVGFNTRIYDRVNIGFSWYNRLTKDALMAVPLGYFTGFGEVMRNVGEIKNTGIEIEADVDVIKTRNFSLNIRANYSYNKNSINKLFDGQDEWVYSGTGIIYKVGEAIQYYMPVYAGVDKETGEQMWYKKGHKGEPTYTYNPETMTKVFNNDDLEQATGKKMNSPHVGGFGISAAWKGFAVNADFNFMVGKWMTNNDKYFTNNPYQFMGMGNQDREVLDMWQKPGDETLQPAFGAERQFDTHLLENASFMRLKNLTVSYTLPQAWVDATHFFKSVRINATGRNLFTVTKYSGADPEINGNIALNSFPNTRQYTIGVEVTF